MGHRAAARRRGFSLIETIVALTLMAAVLSALAALNYRVTKRGEANDLQAKRTFALQHEANRFAAMPFSELATQASGSEAMLLGDFLFTRTLTITAVDANRYIITIRIAPDLNPDAADSLVFDRTKTVSSSALCTTC